MVWCFFELAQRWLRTHTSSYTRDTSPVPRSTPTQHRRACATHCSLRFITRTPSLTDARVEVEIAQREPEPESPITARAVVKALTPGKMQFDKNMFSKMVKESLSFPVKITKQAVSQEELAPSLFQT